MQEFKERLRIFEKNCESVRKLNVSIKEGGRKVRVLSSLPYIYAQPKLLVRSAFCMWHPCIQALVFSACCTLIQKECQVQLDGSIRLECGAVTTSSSRSSVCMQPITKLNLQSDVFVARDRGAVSRWIATGCQEADSTIPRTQKA